MKLSILGILLFILFCYSPSLLVFLLYLKEIITFIAFIEFLRAKHIKIKEGKIIKSHHMQDWLYLTITYSFCGLGVKIYHFLNENID